jgi:predicted enzyme related to lactoylglutathione lyase
VAGQDTTGTFTALDYIYVPAPDFEAAVRFYTVMIGGELRWRIHDGGVRVAAIRIGETGPLVLLASHLQARETILIYRVPSIAEVRQRLSAQGWSDVDAPFEIPPGPCLVFRDPAGQQLAVYERVRPGVDQSFDGRFDS